MTIHVFSRLVARRGRPMLRRSRPVVWLALLAIAILPSVSCAQPAAINVHLLAVNDFHGGIEPRTVGGRRAGGVEALAAHLSEWRSHSEHSITVHAGDMIGASPPISNLLREEPAAESIDLMGIEFGVVGNHELDRGLPALRRLQDGGCDAEGHCFPGIRSRYLAANVIEDATGAPAFPPYTIRDAGGVRVGFIGVITGRAATIITAGAAAGLTFGDEVEAVNRYSAELKAQGIHSIVVLVHEGGRGTLNGGPISGAEITRIATESDPEVDVIVSAHSHQGYQGMVAGKLVTQAYSGGTAFADIDLDIDPSSGDVVHKQAQIVTAWAGAFPTDPAITARVQTWQAEVRPIVERVVTTAAAPITRTENAAGESALGNLISDAMRAAMGSDIACMNAGGIRADLPAGDITYGALLTVQPFGNELTRLTVSGDQLVRLLNQQWAGQPYPRIMKCAGITYTWSGVAPDSARVAIADISLGSGAAIDAAARYTITVNNFMADGGDGYSVLTEGEDRLAGPTDIEALSAYVSGLAQPISIHIEGRIQRR